MLGQIATFLIDTVVTLIVFLMLLRFHFQWMRVPFHNPVGEFVVLTTNWAVMSARRIVPAVAGLDAATLVTAWLFQALGLWAQTAIVGAEPSLLAIAAVAAVDLLRYSVYILVFAIIVQVILSWVNPYAPLAPVFDAFTRPFLRPLRRFVPPIGSIDLSPLVLLILLQVVLIPLSHLRAAAGVLG
jgi:YggT family protein